MTADSQPAQSTEYSCFDLFPARDVDSSLAVRLGSSQRKMISRSTKTDLKPANTVHIDRRKENLPCRTLMLERKTRAISSSTMKITARAILWVLSTDTR